MRQRIGILGGGSAGLFASIQIARAFANEEIDVLLFEGCDRVGRKLLTTGNGRCNLTNANLAPERFHSVDSRSDDLRQSILDLYSLEDTLAFFRSIGVVPVEEALGKIYPASGQASAVLDLLRIEAKRAAVQEHTSSRVKNVQQLANGDWQLDFQEGKSQTVQAILFAMGACASPHLGSDGSGFSLLEQLGHHCTPLYPVIVPIETDTSEIRSLKGQKIDAVLSLRQQGKLLRSEFGELLFTQYGLSGPPALQLAESIGAAQLQNPKAKLEVSLNLLPSWDPAELLLALQLRLAEQGYRPIEDFFTGWLPKSIARAMLKSIGIHGGDRLSYSLGEQELFLLCQRLQDWPIAVKGTRSFENAQATAGGIPLCEWDQNLQSCFCSGLFACGEILDVHGDSGGYNLQWAWSSGKAAANGIVTYLRP